MFDRTANARIIFEEELKRQIRRIGWRIFTVGVPLIMIIDAFSDDDDTTDNGPKIGYVDNSGVTDSIAGVPGLVRMDGLDVGTQALVDEDIEALFVIPADYVSTGNVDWYRKGSGLASEDSTGDAFENVLRAAVADDGLSDELVSQNPPACFLHPVQGRRSGSAGLVWDCPE